MEDRNRTGSRGTPPGTPAGTLPRSYRDFIEQVGIAQLRLGRDGMQMVGNGLVVPYPFPETSEQWEENCAVYEQCGKAFRSPDANGGVLATEARNGRNHQSRHSS